MTAAGVGINTSLPGYAFDVNGYMRTNNRNIAFKYVYTGPTSSFTGTTMITWSVADSTLPYSTVGTNFVAPVAGLYHFTFSWGWGNNSPTAVNYRIYMTKNNPALANNANPDPSSNTSAFSATELCVSANQYLIQACSAPIVCAVVQRQFGFSFPI